MYSTEHLAELGRVEKRTIQLSDLGQFFNNEVIVDLIREAAQKTTDEQPFVTSFLSHDDRWHVMNICLNRISSIFGPFHVFFNEARRCKSQFRSAWYLFTISSVQNRHHGRFFVTPYKPVMSRVDMGVRRLRVDLVNEQEMRDICSSAIVAPAWGFFNKRHEQRWNILVKMGELFENQLVIIEDEPNCLHAAATFSEPPRSPKSGEYESATDDDEDDSPLLGKSWAADNLPGTPNELLRHPSNPRELAQRAIRQGRRHKSMCRESDNCILRVHIPYPSTADCLNVCDTTSKDVVLFE